MVLHHLRRLSGVGGLDDDLDIGKIRDGIERGRAQGHDPGTRQKKRREDDQKTIGHRPTDESRNHGPAPVVAPGTSGSTATIW